MSRGNVPLTLGGEPRVDLMPAEVRDKRRGRGIRRLLALILVLAVTASAAGIGWATLRAATATAELQSAQARTHELLAQQTQYSEVTRIAAHKTKLEQDRLRVTATEVLWREQLRLLLATLPTEASVVSIQARFPAHGEPELGLSGPLRQPRAAELQLQVLTTSAAQVTDWLRALAKTPAFADAMPTVVGVETGGEDGVPSYLTTISLNLGPDALAHRFGVAAEPEADPAESEPEEQQ